MALKAQWDHKAQQAWTVPQGRTDKWVLLVLLVLLARTACQGPMVSKAQ